VIATPEAALRRQLVAVTALTVIVVLLGAAVLAVRLRPAPESSTAVGAAIRRWERLVDANPADEQARVGLGLALFRVGNKDEARRAFEAALKINPKSWIALYQLGLMVTSSDEDQAVRLFAEAAKEAPRGSRAGAFLALGDVLFRRSDFKGARKAYEGAVSDLPFLADAHAGLARTLEALGDSVGALAEYKRAAKVNPVDEELRRAIDRLRADSQSAQ